MQQERVRGGENLIFSSPQEAAAFRESLEQRKESESVPGVTQDKENVAQELAKKFEEHGHGVSSLHAPWEHTPQEHSEVQGLVDLAFTHDLQTALRHAEQSDLFPRNIDLLHDVLTGELYDAARASHLTALRPSLTGMLMIATPILLLIVAIFFFVYSL